MLAGLILIILSVNRAFVLPFSIFEGNHDDPYYDLTNVVHDTQPSKHNLGYIKGLCVYLHSKYGTY